MTSKEVNKPKTNPHSTPTESQRVKHIEIITHSVYDQSSISRGISHRRLKARQSRAHSNSKSSSITPSAKQVAVRSSQSTANHPLPPHQGSQGTTVRKDNVPDCVLDHPQEPNKLHEPRRSQSRRKRIKVTAEYPTSCQRDGSSSRSGTSIGRKLMRDEVLMKRTDVEQWPRRRSDCRTRIPTPPAH